MKRSVLVALAAALVTSLVTAAARADDDPYGYPAAPATWGNRGASASNPAASRRSAPVVRAREMLTRARALDDAAASDEKSATEIAARLPALRLAAKAARDRAGRATPDERELLGARADDLEADVIISEAEVSFKRRSAVDDRRAARDLRALAVKLVRDPPPAGEPAVASSCNPPFGYTTDGRKTYHVECFR